MEQGREQVMSVSPVGDDGGGYVRGRIGQGPPARWLDRDTYLDSCMGYANYGIN